MLTKKQITSNTEPSIIEDDFEVIIKSQINDDTTVLTIIDKIEQYLQSAISRFDPENSQYSSILGNEAKSGETLTNARIDELAENAQNDLKSILTLNTIVRKFINTDDILGRVVESITTNVNGDYILSYNNFGTIKKKLKILDNAKEVINDFNFQINLPTFIRNVVPTAYAEGNYIMYLKNEGSNWVIDYFPLGVAEITDSVINNRPVIRINLKELENRLKKTFEKTKSGKALIFENITKEIEASYPPEVIKAYKAKENYVILDYNRARVIRVNNLNRKYGLSPAVRALKSLMMLDTFAKADEINAKSKAKKIIVQILNDKLLGDGGGKKAHEEQQVAHDNFMRAFLRQTVICTTTPAVKEVKYVEPTTEDVSTDKINMYRNKALTTLGISFMASDRSQTASVANIALDQLLKMINSISEQLELILKDYYRIVLEANGISFEYCPSIKIIDSELMSMDLKLSLVTFLFNNLNASMDTCFNYLGIDLGDEIAKREKENNDGLEEIFKPRTTAHTKPADTTKGRPSDQNSNNPDKQMEDKLYNKTR